MKTSDLLEYLGHTLNQISNWKSIRKDKLSQNRQHLWRQFNHYMNYNGSLVKTVFYVTGKYTHRFLFWRVCSHACLFSHLIHVLSYVCVMLAVRLLLMWWNWYESVLKHWTISPKSPWFIHDLPLLQITYK